MTTVARAARAVLEDSHATVEVLDLSRTTSEYGRNIHPCKACFSTAAALCHWPCSCYPNYSLGQSQDWMARGKTTAVWWEKEGGGMRGECAESGRCGRCGRCWRC